MLLKMPSKQPVNQFIQVSTQNCAYYFWNDCKPGIMTFQACNSWKVHKCRLHSPYVSYSISKVIYYKCYEHLWEWLDKFPLWGRVTACVDTFILQYKLQGGWVANTFKWSGESIRLLFKVLGIFNFPNYLH